MIKILCFLFVLSLSACQVDKDQFWIQESQRVRAISVQSMRTSHYVEEGSIYNGAIVLFPITVYELDYVCVNDNWYYYHPELKVWVHTYRDKNWQPRFGHVYHSWIEHPYFQGDYIQCHKDKS